MVVRLSYGAKMATTKTRLLCQRVNDPVVFVSLWRVRLRYVPELGLAGLSRFGCCGSNLGCCTGSVCGLV